MVEEVGSVWAMERGGAFRGRYRTCWAACCRRWMGSGQLRIGELVGRMADGEVAEVILALPATVDGQTTAHIADRLARDQRAGDHAGARRARRRRPVDWLDDGTIARGCAARRPA
ncbi:toprim domain-containing protein [Caulobacter segnis]